MPDSNSHLPLALVTGGTSGIGLATAQMLAQNGYRVVATTSNLAAGKKKVSVQLNHPDFELLEWDQTLPLTSSESLINLLADQTPAVLINNAGLGEIGSVEETPLVSSRNLFNVNYFSPVELIQKCIPKMKAGGRGIIINISSIAGHVPFPFKAEYSASKAALSAFSRSLKFELSPFNIRVHVVEPGWVRSDFHKRLKPVIPENSPYEARLKPFMDFTKDSREQIQDGQSVAREIIRIIRHPNPPFRTVLGRDAKLIYYLNKWMPDFLIELLIKRALAKKTGR